MRGLEFGIGGGAPEGVVTINNWECVGRRWILIGGHADSAVEFLSDFRCRSSHCCSSASSCSYIMSRTAGVFQAWRQFISSVPLSLHAGNGRRHSPVFHQHHECIAEGIHGTLSRGPFQTQAKPSWYKPSTQQKTPRWGWNPGNKAVNTVFWLPRRNTIVWPGRNDGRMRYP